MLNDGTATLKDVYPWCQELYDFLWLICEAALHFLPIGVVWSITKKMKGTEILGIVTGVTLVSPQLINAYQVATAENIPIYDLGIFQIERIGYQSQIIPAILVGFTLVYLERFFRKITLQSINMIVVPFGALVPTVFLAHAVLGPIRLAAGRMDFTGRCMGIPVLSRLALRRTLRSFLSGAVHNDTFKNKAKQVWKNIKHILSHKYKYRFDLNENNYGI